MLVQLPHDSAHPTPYVFLEHSLQKKINKNQTFWHSRIKKQASKQTRYMYVFRVYTVHGFLFLFLRRDNINLYIKTELCPLQFNVL